jgi:transcriptional regulator with XRE-family HTH domain
MTNLRHLLACNMKKYRQEQKLSQVKLAAKAGVSLNYVQMIELERKFPSPEMLSRLAEALEIDTPQLFSMPAAKTDADVLKRFFKTVLLDIEKAVRTASSEAIGEVIADRIKELDGDSAESERQGLNAK